ncbi:hypothetical protein GCM10010329_28820 [Streptomyces spiroverticillatus]|uniref:HTH cro/C1-type domain-containing protein n=1 Tax=Streptomyces finlayi TaxID=67296 RepID=A0A918WVZ5_9ACTN|nr:helix-turn-helix transcriptional regulator [Streptomyces finlayi]GHA04435.1 hypothetical protein GCM10010329_28820 [Streptomyces spiroverticillatus]GHC88489.1 hypothetical protein GCM10010334_21230 [Streptomyces finlayi]
MYCPTRSKARRERLGLTRRQLADRIGVHEVTVWRWESGEVGPSADNFVRLAHALRIPFASLLAQVDDDAMATGALIAAEIGRARSCAAEPTIRTHADAEARLIADKVRGRRG